MKSSEKFSTIISNFISKTLPDKTEEELEIIGYGLEVLFMNFTKFPIILGLGYLLGVFSYSVYTLIIFGVIRSFASGIHARKSYTCLLSTLIIILGAVYLSLNFQFSIITKLIIFILSLIIYFKYAPADTEEKPYLDPLIRNQLKVESIFTAFVYFFISITVQDVFFSNIFIHVLWIEALLISPIIYKLFKRRFNNYEYYEETI
ncbi:accessory gene regulator B family protein [Clostridium sp. ZS2-4]|uniref:accessory gene regulator B family protein n=1 Tax=Clostridium sp. ZS2-4 TaxID=2987703 RepID=UPI00227BBBEB|nr:accessory gene regulator B family protein [Clostridium sp. ZS2-4]MCY6355309.1 accessory gene regulator B family protein [Clostridium sp. ZS2-4]